jgi:hypothetical protein
MLLPVPDIGGPGNCTYPAPSRLEQQATPQAAKSGKKATFLVLIATSRSLFCFLSCTTCTDFRSSSDHCMMAVSPADRGIQMLGVYSLFIALTTIATALRVYCRTVIVKKFGVDDYLAATAWVGLIH